jgi:hypothetical protein
MAGNAELIRVQNLPKADINVRRRLPGHHTDTDTRMYFGLGANDELVHN